MGRIRYTSDLHFHHPFVAGLRGFSSAGEHDGVILENFNKGTRDDDLTYIAGDFALDWKGVDHILAQLRGRLILIEGNHDIMSSVHRNGWKHRAAWTGPGKFEAIVAYLPRRCAGMEFLISHYPYTGDHTGADRYTQFRLRDEGKWLLHGHTHSREKLSDHPRQIHVGVDAWNLAPVQERDVIDLMKSLDTQYEGRQDGSHA
jgi:calcineurin-like phosphoesterase family protein